MKPFVLVWISWSIRSTWGRPINSRTALFGVSSLSMIRATAVKTGILTLYFCAKAITAPAVDTPSATYKMHHLGNCMTSKGFLI